MKNTLKITSITIACMIAAALLSACGNSSNAESGDNGTGEITVCSREDGSGTRDAFTELFGISDGDTDNTTTDASITNSTEVMMTTVSGNENAIGYCSLGSLNDSVKAVKINGNEATADNVKNGKYEISRNFNIITKDNISSVSQDFINYILSSDGQGVIEDNGYVSVEDGSTFKTDSSKGTVTVAGSSSVGPVMEKLAENYQKVNNNAKVQVQVSDSTTGIQNATDGVCDIGMSSRDLKDDEKKSVKATVIAKDGIAVVVNKTNKIDNLTTDQVKSIYTGKTTKWSDIK